MKNKTLAIICAIIAPWALIAYSIYKHASYNYEKNTVDCNCDCKSK